LLGILLLILLSGPLSPRASVSGQEPSSFTIGEATIRPRTTRAGEPVTLSFTVTNTGAKEAEYEAPVLVGGVVETRVKGLLPSGGSQAHFVPIVRSEANTYQVQVQEQLVLFSIGPAAFAMAAMEVFPSLVGPGDAVEVTGTVTNVGGVPGTYRMELRVNGESRGERSGFLPAGASTPLLFALTAGAPGTHAISVGEAAGSLTVLGPVAQAGLRGDAPLLPETTLATDDLGQPVKVVGSTITLRERADGQVTVELPVALGSGRRLQSLVDRALGVTLAEGVLELPLRSDGGQRIGVLVATVTALTARDGPAAGVVERLRLRLPDIPVNLAVADPDLGLVTVDLELGIVGFSSRARLEVLARKELSATLRDGFEAVAQSAGESVAEVALTMGLAWTDRRAAAGPGRLRFALGAPWVGKYGPPSSVRVGWMAGDEVRQVLPAEYVGRGSRGRLLFEASFPSGATALAILAVVPRPSERATTIRSLSLTPPAAVPGATVRATATVTNLATEKAAAPMTLRLNGRRLRTKTLVLEAGQERTVSFEVSFPQAGTYVFRIGPGEATLQVAPPLDPLVVQASDLRVAPVQAQIGSPVEVSVQVTNTGREQGRAHPLLRLNGVLAEGLPVVLAPGGSRRVAVTVVRDQPGPYRVEMDGLGASFTLIPPPAPATFVVSELAVSPGIVDPGEPATVTFKVSNTGDTAGAFQAPLEVGNEPHPVGSLLVPGHSTLPFKARVASFVPGRHAVRLGAREAFLVVREAKATSFRVANLVIAPREVKPNRPVSVAAVVTNVEQVPGVDQLTLKVDGLVVTSEGMWLGSGVSRGVEFAVKGSSLGVHIVDINGVRNSFTVVRAYSLLLIGGTVAGVILLGATVVLALRLRHLGRLPSPP
jgi:hypothetical protein